MYVNAVYWLSPDGQNRRARTRSCGFQEETKCIDYDFYEKILIIILIIKLKKNKLAVFLLTFYSLK